MTQPSFEEFASHLRWLDGRPLLDTIEGYRREIFQRVFGTVRDDGIPLYNFVLAGRAKKNWKTTDVVLAALYKLLAWKSSQGNDCYLLANDEGQAADDLSLAKKLVWANPTLGHELAVQLRTLRRRDGQGNLRILPGRDAVGQHGKTAVFIGFDEIWGYRSHDLFEALAPDPTRQDVLTWVTSYSTMYGAGSPLHDFYAAAKRGSDPRMFFSWYSADYCTDSKFAALDDGELKANPSIGSWPEGRAYLEQQKARLPRHKYRRPHLNLPGLPEGAALSADNVVDAVQSGRKRLEPVEGIHYSAFVDMSGGTHDDSVLAIAHKDGATGRGVLDLVEKQNGSPPFNPRKAVNKFAAILQRYNVSRIQLDRYAGETFFADFRDHGITPDLSPRTAHQIYEAFDPLLNAGEVELLDVPALQEQALGLVWRGTKIDHLPGEKSDHINSAAGAVVSVLCGRKAIPDDAIFANLGPRTPFLEMDRPRPEEEESVWDRAVSASTARVPDYW